MKQNNLILDKTFLFALRIIKLFAHLKSKRVERELSVQILKSGTSVGANTEEAIGASSKRDFIHKLEIAYREARETRYWLRLLKESKLLEEKLAASFIQECEEIMKILTAILRSSKS
ncbi:MAG TPA: four helix bundle protein [Puia sp.]|nr:four helix bundle protein [Puia sp.]